MKIIAGLGLTTDQYARTAYVIGHMMGALMTNVRDLETP